VDGKVVRDGDQWTALDKAMAKTKDYVGVTGSITFNEIGDRIFPTTMMKVENGKFVETGYIDIGD